MFSVFLLWSFILVLLYIMSHLIVNEYLRVHVVLLILPTLCRLKAFENIHNSGKHRVLSIKKCTKTYLSVIVINHYLLPVTVNI